MLLSNEYIDACLSMQLQTKSDVGVTISLRTGGQEHPASIHTPTSNPQPYPSHSQTYTISIKNARFSTFSIIPDWRTNGRTKPLIELRVLNYKCIWVWFARITTASIAEGEEEEEQNIGKRREKRKNGKMAATVKHKSWMQNDPKITWSHLYLISPWRHLNLDFTKSQLAAPQSLNGQMQNHRQPRIGTPKT